MADGSVEQESCGASPLGYKPTDAELEEEDDGNYVEGVEVVGDEAQEQDDEKQGDDEEKAGQDDEGQGKGDKKQGLDDEKRGLKDEEEEDIVEFSDDDDTKDYVEGVDISDDPRMANEKEVYEDDGTEYSEQTSCSSCGGGGEFEDMEGEEDFEEVEDGDVPEVKAVDETEEAPGEETEADGQDSSHAKDEL